MPEAWSVPERIANNQERNIFLIGSGEDVVAASLYQFTVRFNDRAAIERFLLGKISNY